MRFSKLVFSTALLAAAQQGIAATDFPVRPVSIVVPYSSGQVDVFARALAKGLSEEWKQSVIVENRPGANEMVGAEHVARSAPTGYTVLLGTEASYILNSLLFKKPTYDPDKQLAPVSMVVRAPLVFLVSPGSKAATMKDFIAIAKARSGDPVRYGSSGIGGMTHLPYSSLARDHGLSLVHVPYNGGAAVMQDLLAGNIESALLGAGLVSQSIKAGKLRALAVSANARIEALPDVPTMKEQGVPDINAGYFLGLSVPAGTPQEIIEKIAATSRRVVSTAAFRQSVISPLGFTVIASDPKSFAEHLKKDRPVQEQRVRDSGAQLELK